jgi:hypothetical protein
MVQALRDQLLTGAPLADDEHRAVEGRGTARPLDCVEEREALADELFRPLQGLSRSKIWPTVGGKSHHLARIFGSFPPVKSRKSRKMRVSGNVAQLLLR